MSFRGAFSNLRYFLTVCLKPYMSFADLRKRSKSVSLPKIGKPDAKSCRPTSRRAALCPLVSQLSPIDGPSFSTTIDPGPPTETEASLTFVPPPVFWRACMRPFVVVFIFIRRLRTGTPRDLFRPHVHGLRCTDVQGDTELALLELWNEGNQRNQR